MQLWLSLAVAFVVQETISTTALLTTAYEDHLPLALVHLLWFVIVAPLVALAYALGTWVRRSFLTTRVGQRLHALGEWLRTLAGIYGEELSLMAVAFFFSPALAAVLAALLELPFSMSVALIVIADLAWYLLEWAVVIGVVDFSFNMETAIGISLAIGVVLTVIGHIVRKRIK